MMRVSLQPAFVLHHRPYRETSVILELFTQEHGRISAVAKGVRQAKSKWRSLLQPFVPVLVSWQGRGDLVSLVQAEPNGASIRLLGECLLSGLYLNEILMRLLQKHDPYVELYAIYQATLLELQQAPLAHKTLRLFEKNLLEQIGYGLPLGQGVEPINPLANYRFHPEHGFELCAIQQEGAAIFSGESLLAIAAEELNNESVLRDAKRLMRLALLPLLGQKTLHSRRLFEGVKTE